MFSSHQLTCDVHLIQLHFLALFQSHNSAYVEETLRMKKLTFSEKKIVDIFTFVSTRIERKLCDISAELLVNNSSLIPNGQKLKNRELINIE